MTDDATFVGGSATRTVLWLLTILVLAAQVACTSDTAPAEISRTITVPAEMAAAIDRKPVAPSAQRGSDPAARLGGLEDDSWPPGILFMEYGKYFKELGFEEKLMLVEIDGTSTNKIFMDRWMKKSISRPRSFHKDHYRDLMQYLFSEGNGPEYVLTVYRNVPNSSADVKTYVPEVEYWRLVIEEP